MRVKIFITIIIIYLISYTTFVIFVMDVSMPKRNQELWKGLNYLMILGAIFSNISRAQKDADLHNFMIIAQVILVVTIGVTTLHYFITTMPAHYLLVIFFLLNIAGSALSLEYLNKHK